MTSGYSTGDWSPAGLYAMDHNPWSWHFRHFQIVHLTVPVLHQFLYEDVMCDIFTKVEANNIHCSPLLYQYSHLIVEGYHSLRISLPCCSFLLVLVTWDSWRILFCVICQQGTYPMYQWAYIFLSSLADDVLVEAFLVVLHISLQIQVKWTLVFPTP